jgi:hypothetical protein
MDLVSEPIRHATADTAIAVVTIVAIKNCRRIRCLAPYFSNANASSFVAS